MQLEDALTERRAEAVVWIAQHGRMEDVGPLLKRLRDEELFVRALAEEGLWLLWSRSGDAGIDQLMARGVEEMRAGRYRQSIAVFSQVIERKPAFAEGWNKRATAYYLAGEYRKSLADCDEVMRRNPYHFGALAGYGQIYFKLEQYDKALEYYRKALEVNPNLTGVESDIKGIEQLLREKKGRTI